MLLTKKIITRKEYMENSSELYESYYYQFITPSIMKFVRENYTKEYIQEKFKEDQYLNNLEDGWVKKFDKFAETIKGEIAQRNRIINGENTWSYSYVTSAIKVYMKIYAGIIN